MKRLIIRDEKKPSSIIFFFLFFIISAIPLYGLSQERINTSDKFTYLIENGARMIIENDFEKVLDMIAELPQEKKWDFRIKVLENSAYLKGYMVTKRKVYGQQWKAYYKGMLYSRDKSATLILVELLRDENDYLRAVTAKSLGFIGDQSALEELKRVATHDKNSKVRSNAKWAYEQISGGRFPKEITEE